MCVCVHQIADMRYAGVSFNTDLTVNMKIDMSLQVFVSNRKTDKQTLRVKMSAISGTFRIVTTCTNSFVPLALAISIFLVQ